MELLWQLHRRRRIESCPVVHAGIGKASFTEDQLVANIKAFADAVAKSKPAGSKGTFIEKISVSSTMGPGVKIEPSSIFSN